MIPTTKPTAGATLEPLGRSTEIPREHSLRVVIRLNGAPDSKHGQKKFAGEVARLALAGFAPASGTPDRRGYGDVHASVRGGGSAVVGVEGSVICAGRPDDQQLEALRLAVTAQGYTVAMREKRECAEDGCNSELQVDWNRPREVPAGWHSSQICGKHNYRSCAKCKSLYAMSSTNSAGHAPSLHCEVCGAVMVEWGSSKLWSAELLTRAV